MRRPLTTKRLEGFFGVLAVYGALTVLLFLPKVNVAGPAEGTYIGPKPEDIWIGAWLVLGVPTILRGAFRVCRLCSGPLAVAATSVLVGLSLGHVVNGSGRIEFALRFWMYWLWGAYCAGLTAGARRVGHFLKAAAAFALVWVVALMGLQAAGMLAVPTLGYWSAAEGRVSGIFSHPTELGAVASFLLAIAVAGSRYPLLKLIAIATAAFANYQARNRGGSVGVAVVLALWLWGRASVLGRMEDRVRCLASRIARGLVAGAFLASGVVIAAQVRESGLPGLWQGLQRCRMAADWAGTSDRTEIAGVEVGDDDTGDPSLISRCLKWSWIINRLGDAGGVGWMFGLGPGAVSEAADGLVMRVLGEFGFAGLVAYTLHWLALYRIVRQRVTAPEGVSLGLLALFAQALVLDVLYSRCSVF